jgi:hypothetical protein
LLRILQRTLRRIKIILVNDDADADPKGRGTRSLIISEQDTHRHRGHALADASELNWTVASVSRLARISAVVAKP